TQIVLYAQKTFPGHAGSLHVCASCQYPYQFKLLNSFSNMSTLSALTDTELAAFLQAGNESAFKVIYLRYWEKLLAVAGRRLGNLDEAEDAVQTIFLNLWKRKDNFELKSGFEQYFAAALKFEIINRLA